VDSSDVNIVIKSLECLLQFVDDVVSRRCFALGVLDPVS